MRTPELTTAEAFSRYIGGEKLADSTTRKWPGLFVRCYRFPHVMDGFLVPATAEPLIACIIAGSAEFQEREIGGIWLARHVQRGDIFVTGSKTPYELRWRSPVGAELNVIHIHLALDECRAAFETVYRDKANAVGVIEFFGRDETLAHLSFACAKMLSARTAVLRNVLLPLPACWRFTSPRNTLTAHRRITINHSGLPPRNSSRSRMFEAQQNRANTLFAARLR